VIKLHNVPVVNDCIIGIDPSLTATGVVTIYKGNLFAKTVSTDKKGVERLGYFYDQFRMIAGSYRPARFAIEGYSFGSKFSRPHALGELGGIIRLAILHSGQAEPLEVAPTTLKKFVTGSGQGEKSVVSKELFKRFGVDLSSNDEVDAAGIAIYLLAKLHGGVNLPQANLEALMPKAAKPKKSKVKEAA
jgi:crossover junction endodeoxyribonuclease RuvC